MVMMKMEARDQLLLLFSSTINDLNDVISAFSNIENEYYKERIVFVNRAVSKLEELKASITENGFTDTVENMKTVDEVRQSLGNLRTKILSTYATDWSIDRLLKTLADGVTRLQTANIEGMMAEVNIDSFGEDDLACAIKVTSWLNESIVFAENIKTIMDDHSTMEELVVLIPNEDEEYKSLEYLIDEYENLAATAETAEEADIYRQMLEDFEQRKPERLEEINEINREKREERAQKMQEIKTGYESVLKLLQSIYKQYTGRSFVSYKKRAEILKRSGIGSFDDIFEQLSEARADGDVYTILMVEGKLKVIIDEYEKMENGGIIIDIFPDWKEEDEADKARWQRIKALRTKRGITEAPTQEKEDAEKKARMERLAELAALGFGGGTQVTTSPVTEVKTPEAGTVEKVNVKKEKDPWADLLKKEKI